MDSLHLCALRLLESSSIESTHVVFSVTPEKHTDIFTIWFHLQLMNKRYAYLPSVVDDLDKDRTL